jgi:hypothetical protein
VRRRSILFTIPFVLAAAIAAARPQDDDRLDSRVDTVSRQDDGRVTVKAVRLTQPLRIDGVLDDPLYQDVRPMSDFIQVEPDAGTGATERTEGWVAFDADNVYVSFRAWDSQMDRLVATEMRRDNGNIWSGNDIIVFIFDTFNDRRNSLSFTVNALGGRSDGQVINERQFNADWNPVWDLKTGRFDGGWTLEASLPFKSLRYRPGSEQVWGFNAMRVKRSKNEISTLSRVPPAQGQQGVEQPIFAATLVGIEAPAAGLSLDIKPYVTSNVNSDLNASPQVVNAGGADFGVDAKYSVTQNLTADLTYNTDFAQVEADQQQVNLTRFSLFFPEKREFFLENAGTFSFGGVPVGSLNAGSSDAPIFFYSRRIGLNSVATVPIDGGGRLTGRVGRYTLGMLDIQAADDDRTGSLRTNFTVARIKRDIFRRSSLGLMFTNRSVSPLGGAANRAYGADATFAFFQNLQMDSYWARTGGGDTPIGIGAGDDTSYRAHLNYTGDRYGLELERLSIGDQFNPEIGFVRRRDMVRDFAQMRFSPRPKRRGAIRKFVYLGAIEYIENTLGRLETRKRSGEFALEFQNVDRLSVNYTNEYQFLPAPFRIGGNVVLPVGGYQFDTLRVNYNMGQQRTISANLTAEVGSFYDGNKLTLSAARGRMPFGPRVSVEPTYSFNRVTLIEGDFMTHLVGSRATFTMTPLMFVSALIQYNTGTSAVSTNARLRWEYQPGSELFVVYNDERNTLTPGLPTLSNRAFIVKVNRLFRF